MGQGELFKVDSMRLFEELCRPSVLRQGFREVSKNRGSSGINAITVADYKANLEQEIRELSAELKDWSYKPQPVRRVDIPKGGGGVRYLDDFKESGYAQSFSQSVIQ